MNEAIGGNFSPPPSSGSPSLARVHLNKLQYCSVSFKVQYVIYVIIAECLFQSTHDRKFLGFQLVKKVLPQISANQVSQDYALHCIISTMQSAPFDGSGSVRPHLTDVIINNFVIVVIIIILVIT